ncbi:hypothetical protein HDU98_009929 [Podochytrium sp. JEL0797]|nr:hypothetical protein HDU98_009929 [Podochytrium sp. JEL0797]
MGSIDWQYKTVRDANTKGRNHYWPRGKVLGGCSSTNFMAYVRGNRNDFNDWEETFGCEGWRFDRILPYFAKSENNEINSTELDKGYHSTTGELKVGRVSCNNPHPIAVAFVNACELLGIGQGRHRSSQPPKTSPSKFAKRGIDYNGANQFGAAIFQTTVSQGERQSTAKAFLEPIMTPGTTGFRSNLTVLTGYICAKVTQSGQKDASGLLLVDGVELISDDARKSVVVIKANKEVILSAGAIGSPKVLMHSGIGRKEDLVKHGIASVMDIPAVGYHMQDHIFVPLQYEDLSKSVSKGTPFNILKGLVQYWKNGTGLLASVGLEATAFFNVGDEAVIGEGKVPNLQIQVLPAVLPPDYFPRTLHKTIQHAPLDPSRQDAFNQKESELEHLKVVTPPPAQYSAIFFPTLLHPTSKGTIGLSSSDPFDLAVITPNYLHTQQDLNTFIDGVIATRKIVNQAKSLLPRVIGEETIDLSIVNEIKRIRGIDPRVPDAAMDEEILKSREYIGEFVRRTCVTVYHPVGTCRMGPKGDETVVSHKDLKVFGFSNLRVADASVMPEITSGNTNAPCIMIGEVCADMVKGLF